MKHLLFALSLALNASFSNAQSCGQIVSCGVVPTNPVVGQECWINLQMYCNVGYFLQYYDLNFVGNSVTVNAYYCEGLIQVITYTNDSIPLGVLPAGTYTYFVNVFSSSPNCQAFGQTDQAAGTWQITDPAAGLSNTSNSTTRIYPNPVQQSLYIERGNAQACTLRISHPGGKIIVEQALEGYTASIALPAGMEKGLYFLTLSTEAGNLLSVHKIMKEE